MSAPSREVLQDSAGQIVVCPAPGLATVLLQGWRHSCSKREAGLDDLQGCHPSNGPLVVYNAQIP